MNLYQATTPQQVDLARTLFGEYAATLEIDLSFQGFDAECRGLPGAYAPPEGRLFLAFVGAEAAGCVALRALRCNECEMKRLFVRPAFRGRHIGGQLAEHVIRQARAIGYSTIKLDTLSSMRAAIRLYESLGFARCSAYYETPLKDTVFMELPLLPSTPRLS